MKKVRIPAYVAPFLWSYDVAALNVEANKSLIIKNVLDYGSKEATDWLRSVYSEKDIATVIENTPKSAWSKKSLALWTLLYGVAPKHENRFVGA